MILKASPRLLMESPVGKDGLTRRRLTEEEQIRSYAWWFICMRWIAMLLAAILVCPSVWVFRWLPRSVSWPLLVALGEWSGVLAHHNLRLSPEVEKGGQLLHA